MQPGWVWRLVGPVLVMGFILFGVLGGRIGHLMLFVFFLIVIFVALCVLVGEWFDWIRNG